MYYAYFGELAWIDHLLLLKESKVANLSVSLDFFTSVPDKRNEFGVSILLYHPDVHFKCLD